MDIYFISDQPTTCAICGTRTEWIFEEEDGFQMHICVNLDCNYIFLIKEWE